jgi:hypothetical protein
MENLELKLFRKYKQPTYTIGKLSAEEKFLCDTVEDRIRELNDYNHDGDFDDPGEGKVYGETAIPCGRYEIKLTYSQKLKRTLPILLDVPGYSGIRIHKGLNEKSTLGCIIVGENKVKGGVINSPYWETTIINLIREAIKNKKRVFITIEQ